MELPKVVTTYQVDLQEVSAATFLHLSSNYITLSYKRSYSNEHTF